MEQFIAIGIAAISGGGWFVSKIFGRMRVLEDRIDRMPIDYVLKQDYIREMEKMNDEQFLETIESTELEEYYRHKVFPNNEIEFH